MKIPQLVCLVPCVAGLEDEATLLSMHRAKVSLDAEMTSANLLDAATSRNVSQMASLMQSLVEESIKGDGMASLDDDIRAAMEIIKNTLLKGIRDTLLREHDIDQKAIMDQLLCFDQCKEERTLKEQKCNSHGRAFEYLWGKHKACRADLKAQYISHVSTCNDLDVWVEGFSLTKKPEEECVYDRQYECRNGVCKEGECEPAIDEEFGAWLRGIIKQAEGGLAEWTRLHGICKQEYHAYIALDSKCDVTEDKQERAHADRRQCEHEACAVDYTKCRYDCIDAYHKTVHRVECAEKDRKIDWSASEKIECYIRILLNSPTEEQLQEHCKDKSNCLNEWRTTEYDKCNNVCAHVDYNSGEYSLHDLRESEHGEKLAIDDTSKEGVDKSAVKGGKFHDSTHADIQHADSTKYTSGDAHPNKVNTTHRGGDAELASGRCTQHLDIDFQPIPCADPCADPRPCCDAEYKAAYEDQFMSADQIEEVSTVSVCPRTKGGFGQHQEKYAYNLCECEVEKCGLVGHITIPNDDYCPDHNGGRPKVSITKEFKNKCIHPKEGRPAVIDMGSHTCVDRVEFKHVGGAVGSAGDGSQGNFGNKNGGGLQVVITKTGEKDVVLPTAHSTMGFEPAKHYSEGLWYKIAGAKANDAELAFQLKDGVYDFKMEGGFQIWYGEDLKDWTEKDNVGSVCYDITVLGEYC